MDPVHAVMLGHCVESGHEGSLLVLTCTWRMESVVALLMEAFLARKEMGR